MEIPKAVVKTREVLDEIEAIKEFESSMPDDVFLLIMRMAVTNSPRYAFEKLVSSTARTIKDELKERILKLAAQEAVS